MTLRRTFMTLTLSLGLAVMTGPTALAGAHETASCPTSATFPVLVPPIDGITAGGTGAIVTQEQPAGKSGKCVGTFTVSVGGVPIAQGELVATHSGSSVSARFEGSLANGAGDFSGSLSFNGSTGTAMVEITTAAGCVSLTATFTLIYGVFLPGTITPGSCGDEDSDDD